MITSLPTKRFSAISQWQTFIKSFTHKMAAKATLLQNYVTVTVCIKTANGHLRRIVKCIIMTNINTER